MTVQTGPTGREISMMLADDMVGPCLFLASDASAMLTAQTLIVDGGLL